VHNGTDQNFNAMNARAKLLWVPTEITGLETKLTYSHSGSNRPSQEAASAPFDRLQHVTTTMPTWLQETDTGMLDVKYDMGNGIRFFNQSQYTSTNAKRRVGLVPVNGDADVAQKNVSNEARVSFGDLTNVLSGFGGVYYAHTKTDEKLVLAPSGLSTFDDTKENLGLFTELSYRFAPLWTLTGGLRFQQDHVQRFGKSSLAVLPVNYDQTFTAFLPKVSLAYAVTADWTVGALVSRGYNPGGVSLNLSSTPPRWVSFEEETLWNYELFTRSNFLNNRLSVNGNLFYMDFKNAQYNIPVVISTGVTQSYTINAEKAHAYGLEVGLDYRVVDSVTLKASAGLLRTEIDKISSNIAYQGNEFAKSPGYMLSFGASWDATDKLNLSGQVRHTDGYYSDVANTRLYVINAYTVADARISYQFDPKAQVYGYVKNVFDERAPTYMQQNRGIGGIEASMIEPRMFGVGVKGVF
jgi:outer membrane receptor protein involved in Fe transport